MECKDNTTLGVYDCTDQYFNNGAHWYALTNSKIYNYIKGGSYPDEVRMRIWYNGYLFLPLVVKNR